MKRLTTRPCSRLLAVALLASACGESPTEPPSSSILITGVSPASGGTVTVPPAYPVYSLGGVVIPPQSGLISVSVTLQSAQAVPWAQLNVYLLRGGQGSEYCGQNLPDSPTWGFLPEGWTTTYTVTGFQVYRLPCDVTGVRAILHTRNNGRMGPPTAAETIAEATRSVTFEVRR